MVMKEKNRIWFNPIIFMGFILIFANNCKKDEKLSKKIPIITWANPADIYYGQILDSTQLNATADIPGTFVYMPALGAKLNIGANQILKVSFTPTNPTVYDTVSKVVMINVITKKIPIITWANPADIYYGKILDSTQLNATADVPGAFVYTPVLGTKLEIGTNQILKVSFTPTDVIANDTVSKTVKINILQPITVTDADGNVYHTVTIGNQIWIVENLKTTKYNDGADIPLVTNATAWGTSTTPAYCWIYNDISYKNTYGALYNWYALDISSNGGKNVCPIGWHVPSNTDWETLITYLGGEEYANIKLKEAGTTHWIGPNYATNETGFTALPGGGRGADGNWGMIEYVGGWWSSTAFDATLAIGLTITGPAGHFFSNMLYKNPTYKSGGISVRCVKD